jgi:hypothetical protein
MATACDVCGCWTGLIQDTMCGERVFLMPVDYDTGPTCVQCQEWGMMEHLIIENRREWTKMIVTYLGFFAGSTSYNAIITGVTA